ncbi:DUF2818 family protein [Pseudothauera nasutitermitis]|uniref:DUF2818 family protein n=1 Tax=Pseudothauera nasutitermitis TaxID=2565930 RepID=A0A4S4B3T4_9RHOO|nr:DUF2818 family protein [Pseudothauera nasutitermitis]THF66921.1 DUF2818 family protein [Pseudothauera nasutitermitis]
MSQEAAGVYILLALAFVAANLPFLFERILFIRRPAAGQKGLAWRLLELLLLYFVAGALAHLIESSSHGGAYAQNWEFYATTLSMFVVFAFPGFVYRYLWHGSRRRSTPQRA